MKVHKKLNNNSVYIEHNGEFKIATGSGIGFNHKPGDTIDPSLVERIFVSEDSSTLNQMAHIIDSLSFAEISLAKDMLDVIKSELDYSFGDLFILSLLEHLNFAVKRLNEGIIFSSPISWEIRNFYKKEYKAACAVLKYINQALNIELPTSEAYFIALHFVNTKYDKESFNQTQEFTELISKIVGIVKYHFSIEIDENSHFFSRFLTHLRYYLYRVQNGDKIVVPDDELVEFILGKFLKEFSCSNKIATLIYNTYGVHTPDEEKMYLVLHLSTLVKREL